MVDVLQHYRKQGRFALRVFVIMPDHLHLLLTPAPDVSLENALRLIKGGFSFRLKSKRDVWNGVATRFRSKIVKSLKHVKRRSNRTRFVPV